MRRPHWPVLLGLFPILAPAQVFLNADGPGASYERIEASGYQLETPDCKHAIRHITEDMDADLGKNVFLFAIHRDLDDDRCTNFDRQRLEMKTANGSPANMTGANGDTHTYRWRFKLDAGFQPSPNFCHIHQIKAQGGDDDDAPIITITPRGGSPEQLQIIHVPSGGGGGTVAQAPLAPFKGAWIEAYEKAKYADNGTYSLTLKRVGDGATLLTYSSGNLDMWRAGADISRPKWGIYRSLNSLASLRDESVRFSDFCLAEGTLDCPAIGNTGLWKPVMSRWRVEASPGRLFLDLNGSVRPINRRVPNFPYFSAVVPPRFSPPK